MNIHGKDIKIFAGNSNIPLAEEIAKKVGLPLGSALVGAYSDGESAITIGEVVRGSDVFIIQSTSKPVNDNLMELLVIIDALKRASAGRITAVIPYYGYARQDRKVKARDPISAKLVANLITISGADRILTMDFHAPQLQGFFDIPVDHLQGFPILAEYFRGTHDDLSDVIVVSPDIGSVTRSRKFAQRLEIPLAIIDKRRSKANESQVMNIIGDIKNKKVILVDDIIDTGGTIVNAANELSKMGAKDIYACCSHAVLSGNASEKINNSSIKELVTLNTIPINENNKIKNVSVLSVATVFAEAIERIYGDISISTIFTQQE